MNQSADCIFLIELKTLRILESNQALQKLLGYTQEELSKLTLFDFVAHDSEDINQKINQILEEQQSFFGERRYRTKDGRLVDVEVRASLVHYLDQHIISVVSRDITERKKTEKRLLESEEKYRLITENANDLIGIVNQKFEIEFINENPLYQMAGFSREDLVGKSALEFVYPPDREKVGNALIRGFKEGEGFTETRALDINGRIFWLELRGRTFTDVDGKIKAIIISRDITDRKQKDLQLRESEEQLKLIFENANDLISVINDKFEFEYVNERMLQEVMGYTKEDVIGESSLKFAHPDDVERELEYLRKGTIAGGGQVEARLRRKDGKYVWFDIKGRTFRDKKGNLKGLMVARDMTERREADQKLIESEKKYRLICENANDLIAIINDKFEFEYINEQPHLEIMQYTKEDLLGKSGLDFTHPDQLGADLEKLLKGFESGEGHIETRLRRKDGEYLWFDVKGSTFRDSNDDLKAILILRDMTERKKNDRKLIESEEKFRTLFEDSPNSIVLVNNDGIIVDCNPMTVQNFGYSRETYIGKPFQELSKLFCPEDLQLLLDVFETIRSGFIPKPLELRIHTQDGREIWISVKISLIELHNQTHIQAIIRNITERKLANQSLRESEEKYRIISENANDIITIISRSYVIEFINEEACERVLGYKKEDLLGKSGLDILHPNDLQNATKAFETGIERGEGSAELRFQHKDGHYLWFELKGKTFIDKYGEKKVIMISRNITERKKSQEDLKKSEKKYRNILQNLSDIIVEMSPDGTFLYVSPQIRTILGFHEGEIIGKNGLDFIHPEDIPHVVEKLRQATQIGERMHVEYRVRHKAGHYVDIAVNGGPVEEDGKIKHIGVVRDITKRKDLDRIQNEFYQEISQEIQNPLVKIKDITATLLDSTNLDDLQHRNLRKILKNEDRIEQLMHELFSYSRLKLGLAQPKKEEFYVSDVIKEIREKHSELITAKNLSIQTKFQPDDHLFLDKAQISKVINNLFENAVKFSFPNGIIIVKSVIKDNTWTFSIQDRGIGISKEESAKLFRRYPEFVEDDKLNTTGIGIGLSICKKIIDAYHGEIWGTSDGINRGATFTFQLEFPP